MYFLINLAIIIKSVSMNMNMSEEAPVEGPIIKITSEMVSKAISKMKSGKAAGPSGIIIEMIKVAGDGIITLQPYNIHRESTR